MPCPGVLPAAVPLGLPLQEAKSGEQPQRRHQEQRDVEGRDRCSDASLAATHQRLTSSSAAGEPISCKSLLPAATYLCSGARGH